MDDGHGDITLGDGPEWIGLGEAARRLGVTRSAIYGRIERQTLVTRPKGNRGLEVRWPPPLQRHPDGKGDGQGNIAVTVTGDVMVTTLDDLRERLERVEGENGQLRDQNALLLGQVADLRVEVATAEGRVDAARAVAVSDVEAARRIAEAEIAAKDMLVDELRSMLADSRRPWWRRLLG
jgi:hypothetical protein